MIIAQLFSYFIQEILQDPFAEISGYLAMITFMVALMQKEDYQVKKLCLISCIFWGAHFYFMGLYSGLGATVMFVIRFFCSIKFHKNTKVFFSVTFLTLIVGALTYDGIYSLLPICASLIGTFAYFYLESVKLRVAMASGSLLWLVFHFNTGSTSGIMNEIIVQITLYFTIYRMLHPEGGMRYYANRVKDILLKTKYPDYDRFVFLQDRVFALRSKLGKKFQKILHYDLKRFFQKKNIKKLKKSLHLQKDQGVLESISKELHVMK